MLGLGIAALVLTPLSLPLPVVALDAGHGGGQEGAVGACGLREKDLTLALANRLAAILSRSEQVEPLLIRHQDVALGLAERAARANAAGAALLLSIHANASTNPAAHGVETFFLSNHAASGRLARLATRENDGVLPLPQAPGNAALQLILNGLTLNAAHHESQTLALEVQRVLDARLHSRGRGVLQAPFMVLLGARMAAVLIEVGFLSNPEECAQLSSTAHQDTIAAALATAVLTHIMAYAPPPAAAHRANLADRVADP